MRTAAPDFLTSLDGWLVRVAARQTLSFFLIIFLEIGLRLVLLRLYPEPSPVVADEFSYVLGGQTFAKGRLANPPHPLAEFFETFHESMHPTYASKYPPGQGLFLALGIAIFGNPWFGVLTSVALMCGLICWAIQGWMPPVFGLYGGFFAILIFGLNHYWVNSYWGGAVAACGGALVLGALPRLVRRPGTAAAIALASGLVLLAITRPYEGLVLLLAAGLGFTWWIGPRRLSKTLMHARVVVPLLLILTVGGAAIAYYNHAVTGSAATMPHMLHQRLYASTPVLWILPPLPAGHREYRDDFIRSIWEGWDGGIYTQMRNSPLKILMALTRLILDLSYGAALVLWTPVFFAIALAGQRRTAFLLIVVTLFCIGLCLEKMIQLHYAAPIVPAVLILAMHGMRYIRMVKAGRHRLGLRLTAIVMVAGVILTAYIVIHDRFTGMGEPRTAVQMRENVERKLLAEPAQNVVIVQYARDHNAFQEIVYNGPDIDSQKVVWAIDRGEVANRRLTDYYRGRRIWLLEPDPPHARLTPYPAE